MKYLPLLGFIGGCAAAIAPAECPPGVTCGPPPLTLQLGAELVPPANSDDVAQETPLLAFDQHGVATVVLVPRVRLQGQVLGLSDGPIPAQVLIARPSLISGNPAVVVQAATDSRGGFSIGVPRTDGEVSVTVLPRSPADALYPPQRFTVFATQDQDLTLCLAGGTARCPAPQHSAILKGRVTDPFGIGLAGVRVSAIDVATGEPRSSVAVSADGNGAFTLYLSPDVAPTDPVRLLAAPDPKLALPTLTRDVQGGDASEVEVRMPALPSAQTFQLPVGGISTNGAQTGLTGARVDFEADFGEGYLGTRARYSTSAMTDEAGLATALLIPGSADLNRGYGVTVTPLPESVFARTSFPSIPVGAVHGVLGGVTLEIRPQLSGRLLGHDGTPVKGANVSAQPAAAAVNRGVENAGDLSVPTTLTGADGSFALRVDSGYFYDIELVPPAAAPLPRWSIDNRSVYGDLDLAEVPLPAAVRTQVQVRRADGSPVDNVEVRVVALAWDATCPQQMGACPLPARLRGDGMTDATGAATLLLPAP